jgi:hypothetical protein
MEIPVLAGVGRFSAIAACNVIGGSRKLLLPLCIGLHDHGQGDRVSTLSGAGELNDLYFLWGAGRCFYDPSPAAETEGERGSSSASCENEYSPADLLHAVIAMLGHDVLF